MSFSSMSEINTLDAEALEKEIIRVSQELVNLRVKNPLDKNSNHMSLNVIKYV